jgi:hypothetical protein
MGVLDTLPYLRIYKDQHTLEPQQGRPSVRGFQEHAPSMAACVALHIDLCDRIMAATDVLPRRNARKHFTVQFRITTDI